MSLSTHLTFNSAAAVAVLLAAASRGVEIHLNGDRLLVRGADRLTDEERRVLRSARDYASDIACALAWRLEAMRPQVPKVAAPIPLLVARPHVRPGIGHCSSCGDPQPEAGRCPLCVLAAWMACSRYQATSPDQLHLSPDTPTNPKSGGQDSRPDAGRHAAAETVIAELCCGEHAGEEWVGKPFVPACKLCPKSPTYWQRQNPEGKRNR